MPKSVKKVPSQTASEPTYNRSKYRSPLSWGKVGTGVVNFARSLVESPSREHAKEKSLQSKAARIATSYVLSYPLITIAGVRSMYKHRPDILRSNQAVQTKKAYGVENLNSLGVEGKKLEEDLEKYEQRLVGLALDRDKFTNKKSQKLIEEDMKHNMYLKNLTLARIENKNIKLQKGKNTASVLNTTSKENMSGKNTKQSSLESYLIGRNILSNSKPTNTRLSNRISVLKAHQLKSQ